MDDLIILKDSDNLKMDDQLLAGSVTTIHKETKFYTFLVKAWDQYTTFLSKAFKQFSADDVCCGLSKLYIATGGIESRMYVREIVITPDGGSYIEYYPETFTDISEPKYKLLCCSNCGKISSIDDFMLIEHEEEGPLDEDVPMDAVEAIWPDQALENLLAEEQAIQDEMDFP